MSGEGVNGDPFLNQCTFTGRNLCTDAEHRRTVALPSSTVVLIGVAVRTGGAIKETNKNK